MKPFWTIAIPHKDILEGRLTMDVFAADLWQVFKGEAPDEYKDPDLFFRKTYLTKGMKNLLEIVKKRLDGKGGDPVIQLQTPFGGGKTHSLIALYHKAKEWNAKVVVIDGTALDAQRTTLWAEIERQLTGSVELLKEKIAPGRENLRRVLEKHQPLLILIDEVLEYAVKAAGVKVVSSDLASQTLAFMQELTETVATLPNSVLVLTLPSSLLEHYDENAEFFFQQLQKVVGRMEKIYTPVEDEEISLVIRKRLFSDVNEEEAKKTIEEFLDYAEREKILPEGVDRATYRERFIKSFPFQPEVIDVLYKRWGSLPTFQRTRGVLRILALVVHSLKDSKNPFIRLGDFDLKNEEIRRELIKHIGQEFDSIIAADITSDDAGAKKVDRNLGDAYVPFSFGTKSATAIFMYSFSGGQEKGATINEIKIKLACADPSIPSSVVAEAVSKLKENLFYISDHGLFFTNKPNLNRILLNKMENITERELKEEEKDLLRKSINKEYFDIYLWPKNTKDVPDTTRLKLVILEDCKLCKDFLENFGDRPRIYRNTLIFLCPFEPERIVFENFIKKKLAWKLIEKDITIEKTKEQEKEIREKIKKSEEEEKERIRYLYRLVFLPSKEGLKEIDLGIPTYGADILIDRDIYEKLRSEGEILERLSDTVIKDKYLRDRDYVETKNILESSYKTPGEMRFKSDAVLKDAIKEGVRRGLFGIGTIENGEPVCKYFQEECSPTIEEGEIIIRAELCSKPKERILEEEKIPKTLPSQEQEKKPEHVIKGIELDYEPITKEKKEKYQSIYLKLKVPSGKISDFTKTANYIRNKFREVSIKIEIFAQEGEISKFEYEDKIKEGLQQAGIDVEREEVK